MVVEFDFNATRQSYELKFVIGISEQEDIIHVTDINFL